MSGARTTPIVVAILAGSALIAAAVYFGLRSRGAGEAPAKALELPVARPVPAVDVANTAAAAAAKSLAAKRPQLVEECWAPSVAASAEPASVKYTLDATFDAAGRQITLGVSETRGFARADVAACLRRQPHDLRIPAPGRNVRVTLPLAFP